MNYRIITNRIDGSCNYETRESFPAARIHADREAEKASTEGVYVFTGEPTNGNIIYWIER